MESVLQPELSTQYSTSTDITTCGTHPWGLLCSGYKLSKKHLYGNLCDEFCRWLKDKNINNCVVSVIFVTNNCVVSFIFVLNYIISGAAEEVQSMIIKKFFLKHG